MSWSKWLRVAVVLAMVGWLALPLSAGTRRDDVPDAAHLALALDFPSVGQFSGSASSGGFFASGVLIAPNWVLTAAHVVDGATSLSFTIDGASYAAESWIAHPNWDGDLLKGYDIGLVKLPGEGVTGIDPAARYRGGNELGSVATFVGYGMTGSGITGANVFDGQKRAGENVIDAWLPTPGNVPRVLLADFDRPTDPSYSNFGSAAPLPLEYLIAPGDSGGGGFATLDGTEYLLGIHSFGWGRLDGIPDSSHGDVSGHTRVSAFNDWIDGIVSAGHGGDGGGKGKGPPEGKRPKRGTSETFGGGTEVVPEPSVVWLACLGGLTLLGRRRPRRRPLT